MRFKTTILTLAALLTAGHLSAQTAAPKRLTKIASACSTELNTPAKGKKVGKSAHKAGTKIGAKECKALEKRGFIDKNGKVDTSKIKGLRKALKKHRGSGKGAKRKKG